MTKRSCVKELLQGHHKVQPIRAVNKQNSRFAYKLYVGRKSLKGEWELDGVNVSKGTFIYKKVGSGCQRRKDG